MIRNLKAFGLALIAVFAMTAVAAAGAQAQGSAQLTVEGGGTATLDGTQPEGEVQVLTRGVREVTCNVATFHAEESNGDTTATITPTYDDCHTNLGGPATITMNECDYLFHLSADAGDTFTATADLKCPAGKQVVIHAYISETQHKNSPNSPSCQYTFGETGNQGLGTIDLTNKEAGPETPKDWILADINVGEVDSKRTIGSALLCGPENHTTGTLIGEAILKGTKGGEPAGITVSTE